MANRTEKLLLAFGFGSAATLAAWWLWKANTRVPDPADFVRPVAKVARLCLYPIKSCHRIDLPTAHCGARGLRYDRCWAVVGKEGCALSQTSYLSLAQVMPRLVFVESGDALKRECVVLYVSAPGMPELIVREPAFSAATDSVRVQGIVGQGADVGEEAAMWFQQYLEVEGCRLCYMAPHHKARTLLDAKEMTEFCRPGDETSFAGFSPVLITSEASLSLLNSHMQIPLPMDRFRANIILTDCQPHEEDEWGYVKIGSELILRSIKPCGRCRETTVDQEKGVFTGPEPLQTLKTYRLYETVHKKKDRRFGQNPLFGSNYAVILSGCISVGDTVACQ